MSDDPHTDPAMNSANNCPDCGAPLPADAPQGNCPHCLWRLASKPAAPDEAATVLAAPIIERPGDRIGRYKLLEKLGEGGFGGVYMAEQREPVRRRVALKIIKVGMDTREVVARFEAERQALALMDHPNIANILDGGATDAGARLSSAAAAPSADARKIAAGASSWARPPT